MCLEGRELKVLDWLHECLPERGSLLYVKNLAHSTMVVMNDIFDTVPVTLFYLFYVYN